MKNFKFRLQKVMEYKEEIERLRKLDLNEAKERVFKEEEKLEQLKCKDRDCRRQIKEKEAEDKINPVEVNFCYRYLKKLGTEIELQNDRILVAKTEEEKKRQVLLIATKERKILEKLKEKKYSAYATGLARKEQVVIDDVASTAFTRRRLEQ